VPVVRLPLRLSPVLRDMVVVAMATMVTNLAAYLMSVVVALVLPPAEFGAFGSLLSLSVIGSTVSLGAQTVAARRVATDPDADVRAILRTATLVSAGLLGALTLLSIPLAGLLDVSAVAVWAALASVCVIGPAFALLGVVQGGERHGRYGAAYAALGAARAVGAIAAAVTVPTAESAAVGMLAGAVLGTVLVVVITRVPLGWGPRVPGLGLELARNVGALLGLYVLTNIDVVLARAVLPAAESGHYALGSLVAKVAFFLPAFVVYVLFPRMAGADAARVRRVSVLLTAASGLAMTAGTALVAPWFASVMGESDYGPVSPVLWVFALQGGVFAVLQSLLYARMAGAGSRGGPVVWGGLVVFVLLVVLVAHGALVQVVVSSVTVGVLVSVVIATVDTLAVRRRAEPAGAARR
jgi:O-antigen/teichoic acid export membrane protein